MQNNNDVKKYFSNLSSLLLDEPPLIVLPSLAIRVGLEQAIVLQQIHYFLGLNYHAGRNIRDDRVWTYNSYEKWQQIFPFFSKKTVQRIFVNLEKDEILISENYNNSALNRIKWYTVNYEKLKALDFPKSKNARGQFDLMQEAKLTSSSITENTTETTTTTNSSCGDLYFPKSENKEEADKIAGRVIKYYTGSGVAIKNSNGLKHHLAKKALQGELEIPDGFAVAESLKNEATCSSCGKQFPQENMMRKNNSLICVKCFYQD